MLGEPSVMSEPGPGLGILSAAILLAGEMAGSGVLALPGAMLGTGGILGMLLIISFTINSLYSGTRLGWCWIMLEERYTEYQGQVRDPYPSIAMKAVGGWGRVVSTLAIALTLYGGCCVFLVLISQLLGSLIYQSCGVQLSLCVWMVIVAALVTPLTWLGTPKDFWGIAVGALLSTMAACVLIIVNCIIYGLAMDDVTFPDPSVHGSFQGKSKQLTPVKEFSFLTAFASIMFAYAGASTFPTIQADMKEREKFIYSAIIAILSRTLQFGPIRYFIFPSSVPDLFPRGRGLLLLPW